MDAGAFDPVDVGPDPGRDKHQVGLEALTVGELYRFDTLVPKQFLDAHTHVWLNALVAHHGRKQRRRGLIELPWQQDRC